MHSPEYLRQLAKKLTAVSAKYTRERRHELNESDRLILTEVLSNAILDFGSIVLLTEGSMYSADFCEITNEDGKPDRHAVEWVYSLLSAARWDRTRFDEAEHLGNVIDHLKRYGFFFKPIKLTKDNEFLVESQRTHYKDHTHDEVCFEAGHFEHQYCGGTIIRRRTSRFKDVLFCECGLRVIIPTGLRTVGDIRRALSHIH